MVRIVLGAALLMVLGSAAYAQTAPPVLAPIGAQSVNENALLTINVSATDVDATISVLSTSALPTGASFTDNLDGTGSLTWTPTYAQSGIHNVTFYATDVVPPDVDSEVVVITVNDMPQTPVVTDILDQSIAEGATFTAISLDAYVSDDDNTDAEMVWTYGGNTELTVSITDRVATITIPNVDWYGSETITFTATDPGSLFASDAATFTVTAVNDAPVVSDIPGQSIAEGASFTTLDLNPYVTDIDGTVTWTYSGNTDLSVNIVAGVATIGIPTADWYGSEIITFVATDTGLLSDSDPATFEVTAVNDAPVVTDIPGQTIAEGASFTTLDLNPYVTDIDGTVTWTYSGNTDLSVNIVAGVATIGIPGADWYGSEIITFIATDTGLLSDSDPATFEVTAVNDAPVLATIGPRSVTEGANLNFAVSASDIDGETPTLTSSIPPPNATFVDNGNGTGTFNFDPNYLQSGDHTVTFYARDAALLVDSEVVTITVNEAGNQIPALATIGPRSVAEGGTLTFSVSATDIEDPSPALTTSTLPSRASFVDNGDGTGSFTFLPNYQQAGVYQVTFIATDDSSAVDQEIVTITVNEAGNQPPALATIGPRSVIEGALLTFGVSATDPDGTTPTLSTSALPTNAGFVDNGNGTGNFSFAPDYTQASPYSITFRASDGLLADSEIVVVTVIDAGNRAPVLADIGPRTVTEGANLHVVVSATDADGTIPVLTTSTLPLNATFVNNGDGTGDFDFNPDYLQSGIRSVTFYASDGVATDSEVVFITTYEAGNQNPTLSPIGPQAVTEGGTLIFGVSASDPEGASPSLSTSSLPANASFVDNHDGTGTFTFNPDFTQAAPYDITFTVTDDSSATDFEVVRITVNEAGNQTPVLAAIGSQATDENVLLTFGVSATDPDATIPALTTSTLPANASFTDNGDGTGTFNWTPSFTQSGSHDITFFASDGLAADSEIVSITVNNVNRPPELDAIGPRVVDENSTLNFSVAASDPDLTTPALSATGLPANATFLDNGNGTGSFAFTPTYYQAGTFDVTFAASDGTLIDDEIVTITVNNVNQAPVLNPIGPLFVTEGQNLNVLITSFDADSAAVTLTASPLPLNSTFVDNGNGTGTFNFDPSYRQSGIVSLTFTVNDGAATDQELVFITINEAGNQNPVLSPIGPQTVPESFTLNVAVTATDPEGAPPSLTTSALPANSGFVDNHDGTGSFTFTPDFTQSGAYDITFTATDDSSATDFEIVSITVVESGNQAPVVLDIPNQTTEEGAAFATINLDSYVSDADNTAAEITWAYSGNAELSVSIDINRIATITLPSADWNGAETITFTATDPGLLSDSDPATFEVTAVNDAPVVTDIPGQSIAEGASFTTLDLNPYVTDIDGTVTWTYSGNTDLSVNIVAGVATIGIPGADWYGSEIITFIATDTGLLSDSDPATFEVTAVNDAPVVSDIPGQSIAEGASFTTLDLNPYVTDIDGTVTWTYSGNTDLSVNIVAGVATIGIPTADWYGSEIITFVATDTGLLSDSDPATFEVTAVNDAPVVSDIPGQTIAEGSTFATISLDGYVSDIDNTVAEMTWTYSGNTELSVSIDINRIATVTIPNPDWNGAEAITLTATDPGLLFASDAAIFVVTAVNDAPVVADIPDQTIAEGSTFATISLDDYVGDIDNTDAELIWTYGGNTELTVDIDVNRIATITMPSVDWNGGETITFTATDPGLLADSDPATFAVSAGNDAPVVADIPDQSIAEGSTFATINLDDYVSDIDNTDAEMTWTYSGNTELVVSINVSRIATITIPNLDWNRAETITFTATDPGLLADSDPATFTVTQVNDAPIVTDIPDQTIAEGTTFATVSLDDYVSDIDNTDAEMTWTYSGATELAVSIDINRVATITIPSADWNGAETIIFTATDPGLLADSDPGIFTVTAVADAPVLAIIGPQSIAENANLNFVVSASDADNTVPSLGAALLPSGASFTDNGNGTGTFDWTPGFTQAGVYPVTFVASDGVLADSEVVQITVVEAGNQPPVLATIGPRSTTEDVNLNFSVSATDIDATTPVLTAEPLPSGAVFTDNGNGTGTFDWTPGFTHAGVYPVTFVASDGVLVDSEVVQITVIEAGNQTPVLATIGPRSTTESANLNFSVSATDIDATTPLLTADPLPSGAVFTDNGNGTSTFDWTPGFTQAGVYPVTFVASDGVLADSEVVQITVIEAGNQTPVLATIGPRSTTESANLNFSVSATDIDATIPVLTADPLPSGAVFTDHGNGTGTFDWTPGFTQTGIYDVWFVASDGIAADSEQVTITVNNTNRIPTAAAGPDQFDLPAGQVVQLDGTGSSDPDSEPLTYSWAQVGGSSVILSSASSATPTFTPAAIDVYIFELTVSDGLDYSLPDTVSILVVNGAPPQAVTDFTIQRVGDELQFTWSPVMLDITDLPTTINRYVIYRGTSAYFTPSVSNEIGTTDAATTTFTDNNIGGADVVGDTLIQYFYVMLAVDAWENSSGLSNRVGEYDYQILTTPTTDYNLVAIPFTGTGITTADQLIAAIGTGNVLTVNRYVASSQSFQSRFAAGFGTNFAVDPGGIYQVNAAAATTLTVAGNVPAPGAISYPIITTATTDYNFLMVPFDRAADFSVAQDVINNIPGVLNTLNNFVAASQSYQSRFAAGFGTNFAVRAGKPYQANAAAAGTFPVE